MNDKTQTSARLDRMTDIAFGIIEAVSKDIKQGVPADKSLSRIFREHREYGSRDRRFYSDTTYAYFRWLGWTQSSTEEAKVRCALAALLDDAVSDKTREIWAAACSLPASLIDQLSSTDLNEKAKHLSAWANIDLLSPAQLIPAWVANEVQADAFDGFSRSCQLRPPTWVHVTPSRIKAFTKFLETQNVDFRQHDQLAGAFAIEPPFRLEELERGWGNPIQVQDLASQVVVSLCGVQTGDSWWDTCCGSGGKTLGLAEACGSEGNVVATDVRISILRNLKKRAKAHRYKKIHPRLVDVTNDSLGPAKFEGVLVDAPCSGTGTWSRNPDARWRTDPENINHISQTQSDLLNRASDHVKPGGKLVYSVCTVTNREGPEIVSAFLKKHPDFERMPFQHPLNTGQASGEIQIMPDEGPCDGMYIAVMKRQSE